MSWGKAASKRQVKSLRRFFFLTADTCVKTSPFSTCLRSCLQVLTVKGLRNTVVFTLITLKSFYGSLTFGGVGGFKTHQKYDELGLFMFSIENRTETEKILACSWVVFRERKVEKPKRSKN